MDTSSSQPRAAEPAIAPRFRDGDPRNSTASGRPKGGQGKPCDSISMKKAKEKVIHGPHHRRGAMARAVVVLGVLRSTKGPTADTFLRANRNLQARLLFFHLFLHILVAAASASRRKHHLHPKIFAIATGSGRAQ